MINGFRRFNNKTCKEALSSLIKKEFMLGHRGLVPLDKNYFKTSMLDLTREYVTVVPDLIIGDTERLKESNKRMSDNILELQSEKETRMTELKENVTKTEEMLNETACAVGNQSEKDSRIAELEKKVVGLEGLRDKSIAMENVLEEPKGGGAMAGETDALNALLHQLEEAHKANMKEIRVEKDREINELKKMMAETLERVGTGGSPLSEHEAKEASLKDQQDGSTRATRATDSPMLWQESRCSTPDGNQPILLPFLGSVMPVESFKIRHRLNVRSPQQNKLAWRYGLRFTTPLDTKYVSD